MRTYFPSHIGKLWISIYPPLHAGQSRTTMLLSIQRTSCRYPATHDDLHVLLEHSHDSQKICRIQSLSEPIGYISRWSKLRSWYLYPFQEQGRSVIIAWNDQVCAHREILNAFLEVTIISVQTTISPQISKTSG